MAEGGLVGQGVLGTGGGERKGRRGKAIQVWHSPIEQGVLGTGGGERMRAVSMCSGHRLSADRSSLGSTPGV